MRKIIIDCDTGIDDALAILLAGSCPDLDILGITTVCGNVPVAHTAMNSVRICTLMGREIPVYAGAPQPLYRERKTSEFVHGKNGIGDVDLPASYPVMIESARSFLSRSAAEYPGELEIITLGPLTNIAEVILTDEDFAGRVHHLTLMGGAVEGGNVTPCAEFNIYADPEAARIVAHAGIPLTMVGLDVTHRAILPNDVITRWDKSENPVTKAAGSMLAVYKRFYDGIGAAGVAMHDPLTVAAVIDPTLIWTIPWYVDIETRSPITRGKTVADRLGVTAHEPNMQVAMEVDAQRFTEMFVAALEALR